MSVRTPLRVCGTTRCTSRGSSNASRRRRRRARISRAGVTSGSAILLAGCAPSPDLEAAHAARGPDLIRAIDRSLAWHADEPSETLVAFRELVTGERTARAFAEAFRKRFEWSAEDALFTGYFAPEYEGSRAPSARYPYPLYAPPPEPLRAATRREIESGVLRDGLEIAWLADPLDAYLVHVNGSARLRLADGSSMCVGHVATNERPYTSLGRLLVDAGLSTLAEMSMQRIRELHDRHPETVRALMLENDRYVYFEELPPDAWPRSSLGITLTPWCSLAADRSVRPAGGLVLVETELPDGRRLVRFMLDQDSGGAITGAGRADLFMGVGDEAGAIAGMMRATGTLYTITLRERQ